MNHKALAFFRALTKKEHIDQETVKLSKRNNLSAYDRQFVSNFLDTNVEWLDIGAGTGLLINELCTRVKSIVAVEPFQEFSAFITKADTVFVVNETYAEYLEKNPEKRFDLITCFGLCNYLDIHEAEKFYAMLYPMLKDHGNLIIKNQFGVHEDVIIDKFSDELQSMYYSEYRTVEHEKKLMAGAGFKNFAVADIYPPECNRWENTHFYTIVAAKG